MRHRVAFRKLGRDTAHRLAMLRTMTTQLIKYERVRTTVAKAKELRRPAEQMVTLAKKGHIHAKRQASQWLREPEMVEKLFETLGPRYEARAGGYTRVLKDGYRLGDNAPMAYIEYVDNGKIPLRMADIKDEKLLSELMSEASLTSTTDLGDDVENSATPKK